MAEDITVEDVAEYLTSLHRLYPYAETFAATGPVFRLLARHIKATRGPQWTPEKVREIIDRLPNG
jgi:hypothetical protein